MPRLQSQIKLKSILRKYFGELVSPVAWCTSAGPVEILYALGFNVYFPENHGALLGASRLAEKYIPKAQQLGYGGEICSYLTSDIGAWLSRETPLTAAYGLPSIPKPDLIVFNTNQCREVAEWFNFYGEHYGCPVFGIFPPRHLEEVAQADIDNVVSQLENLIRIGEEVIGKSMDEARLAAAVDLSYKGTQLWKQVLNTAMAEPSPLTFFDGTILMAPIVVLRGTQVCNQFYEDALAELEEMVQSNSAAVPSEKVRIFWDGMPIWGRLRALSELFAANGAAVVASTYCNSWVFDDLDSADPLASMASAYTKIFINRGEYYKQSALESMINQFNADGIIFHDAKTCFHNSNNRFGLPKRLYDAAGIDCLVIDGDLNDLRFFTDGQTRTKIETFIEQLAEKKHSKIQSV